MRWSRIPVLLACVCYSVISFAQESRVYTPPQSMPAAVHSIELSSEMLNMHGPLSFHLTWSDQYQLIGHVQYTALWHTTHAYSIIADMGLENNRLNVTWGHAVSPTLRFKVTGEGLWQRQTFSFDSGETQAWVSQYAVGIEGQYVLGKGILKQLSVGGYYAHALNRTLSPKTYLSNGVPWLNYRHIAGSNSTGIHVDLGVQPWPSMLLIGKGYYDTVHYHHRYSRVAVADANQLGYGLSLHQSLSRWFTLNAALSYRALYHTVEIGMAWAHNIIHHTRALMFSLSGSRIHTEGTPVEHRIQLGLTYQPNAINPQISQSMPVDGFKHWMGTPAVHMARVLAAADQFSEPITIQATSTHPLHFESVSTANDVAEKITFSPMATNLPGGTLVYDLTVAPVSDEFNTDDVVIQHTPVTHNTYTVHHLHSRRPYQATLTATESHTHLKHEYTDVFTPIEMKMPVAGALVPTLTHVQHQPDGSVTGKLMLQLPQPTRLNASDAYLVQVNDDKKNVLPSQRYTQAVMKQGIPIPKGLLYTGKKYRVTAISTGNTPASGNRAQGELAILPGKITWPTRTDLPDVKPSYDYSYDDSRWVFSGTSKVDWDSATPSVSEDVVKYSLIVKDNDAHTDEKRSGDQIYCPNFVYGCGTAVNIDTIPGHHYTATITAYDTYDASETRTFNFSVNPDLPIETWIVDKVLFKRYDPFQQSGEVLWMRAKTSQLENPNTPKYTIKIISASNKVIVPAGTQSAGNGEENYYTITPQSGLLPNTTYYVRLTASCDGETETRGENHELSFTTPKGVIKWNNAGQLLQVKPYSDGIEIQWPQAIPSIKTSEITYVVKLNDTIINQISSKSCDLLDGQHGKCQLSRRDLQPSKKYKIQIEATDPFDATSSSAPNQFFTTTSNDSPCLSSWYWIEFGKVIRIKKSLNNATIAYHIDFSRMDDIKTKPRHVGPVDYQYQYKTCFHQTCTTEHWTDFKDPPVSKHLTIHSIAGVTIHVKAHAIADSGQPMQSEFTVVAR